MIISTYTTFTIFIPSIILDIFKSFGQQVIAFSMSVISGKSIQQSQGFQIVSCESCCLSEEKNSDIYDYT